MIKPLAGEYLVLETECHGFSLVIYPNLISYTYCMYSGAGDLVRPVLSGRPSNPRIDAPDVLVLGVSQYGERRGVSGGPV